jgi:hypothetical protein
MNHYIAIIQSANLGMGLSLDSRGYVRLTLLLQDDHGNWHSLPEGSCLTCEYLEDFAGLSVTAMEWITKNCERITEEGRHLYWRYKEPCDVALVG